jgi:hypothetical protein
VGPDVVGHQVVRLAGAAAAVVALDLGDGEEHVAVDAGLLAGLEGDGHEPARRVGEGGAEAGSVRAAGRSEEGGRQEDEEEDAGGDETCEPHEPRPILA